MKPEKRLNIKVKCRQCNQMIRKNIYKDYREIEQTINEVMSQYFDDKKIFIKDAYVRCNIDEGKAFLVGKSVCSADIHTCNSIIFINFYKPPAEWGMKDGDFYINHNGKFVKRLSLANFIFKYCNPFGLILLEKIMFDIS